MLDQLNDEEDFRQKTLEMLQDALFFERNIKDSRLSDFQDCYRQAVCFLINVIGFQSRDDMLKSLEGIPAEDFWAQIKSLQDEIHKRVDSRMNVMTELFFKGDEIDQVSRVFFQSTFQRIRRIISTAKADNIKTVSDILYRLIILSVLCQYRQSSFNEAFG